MASARGQDEPDFTCFFAQTPEFGPNLEGKRGHPRPVLQLKHLLRRTGALIQLGALPVFTYVTSRSLPVSTS